jgi:hypothetical protein
MMKTKWKGKESDQHGRRYHLGRLCNWNKIQGVRLRVSEVSEGPVIEYVAVKVGFAVPEKDLLNKVSLRSTI